MTRSWSRTVFLRLNAFHGRHPWVDRAMVWVAHGLVYPLIILFVWQTRVDIRMVAAAYALGYAANYLIALAYRHERPVKELPDVHLLVRTLGTWKSFPSDHAMTSAIAPTLAALIGAPAWLTVFLGVCAVAVGFSRVYVGVHYPRDIIGGFTVGAISAIVAYSIVIS